MNTVLSIVCKDLSDEALQELTFDIHKTLNQETRLNAEIAKHSGKPGDKGDAIIIGQIVLTALTSGTVVALLNVIKSYIEQNNSLQIDIQRIDGASFKIVGGKLSKAQYEKTLEAAKEFFKG